MLRLICLLLLGLFLPLCAWGVPAPKPAPGNPVVVMETSAGTIKIELFKDKALITVENFFTTRYGIASSAA
jgi:hypothetical protein